MTRTLLMESGLFRDFFENFSMRGERYYVHVHEVGLKRTSENLELGKTQMSFYGWRGPLVGGVGYMR